jgi:hypothetical protein
MASSTSTASDYTLKFALKEVLQQIIGSSHTSLELKDINLRLRSISRARGNFVQKMRALVHWVFKTIGELQDQLNCTKELPTIECQLPLCKIGSPITLDHMSESADKLSRMCTSIVHACQGRTHVVGRSDHYENRIAFLRTAAPERARSIFSGFSRVIAEEAHLHKRRSELESLTKQQKGEEKEAKKQTNKRTQDMATEESLTPQEAMQQNVASAFQNAQDKVARTSVARFLQSWVNRLIGVSTIFSNALPAVAELQRDIESYLHRVQDGRKRILIRLQALFDEARTSPTTKHVRLFEHLSVIIGDTFNEIMVEDQENLSEYVPFGVWSESLKRPAALIVRNDMDTDDGGMHFVQTRLASLALGRSVQCSVAKQYGIVEPTPNSPPRNLDVSTPVSLGEVAKLLDKYKTAGLRSLDATSMSDDQQLPEDQHRFLICESIYDDLVSMFDLCVKGLAEAKQPVAISTIKHDLPDDGKEWPGGATWEQRIHAPLINVFSSQQFREVLRILQAYDDSGRNWDTPPTVIPTVKVVVPKGVKPFTEETTLTLERYDPSNFIKHRLTFGGHRVCASVDSGGAKSTTVGSLIAGGFNADCDGVERHIYVAGGLEGDSGDEYWRPFFGTHPNVVVYNDYDDLRLCQWIDARKGGEWNKIVKVVLIDDLGKALMDKKNSAIAWLIDKGRKQNFTVIFISQHLEHFAVVKKRATMWVNGIDDDSVHRAKAHATTGGATINFSGNGELFARIMDELHSSMEDPFCITFKPRSVCGCEKSIGAKANIENTTKWFVRPPLAEVVFPPDSSRWYGRTDRPLNTVQDLVADLKKQPKRGRPPKQIEAVIELRADEAEVAESDSEREEESVGSDDDEDDDDDGDDNGGNDDDDGDGDDGDEVEVLQARGAAPVRVGGQSGGSTTQTVQHGYGVVHRIDQADPPPPPAMPRKGGNVLGGNGTGRSRLIS